MTDIIDPRTRSATVPPAVRMTTGGALVRFLQAQHSERDGHRQRVIPAMFGIFGHGNLFGIGDALAGSADLRFYQPKNEQSMVHAAIGYAKATARLATMACTTSIGPGSTNMLTGAAAATANCLPVLLLPADTFATRRQGPVLQQLERRRARDETVNDGFRAESVFFDRITRPEQLLDSLPEAIRVLLDPAETGAVTLSIAQDVLGEAAEFPADFFAERTWHVIRQAPAAASIERAAELLREAERPLIIAGGGVRYSNAGSELAALSSQLGIPVAETPAGKGAVLEPAELVGGIGVNGTRAANDLAREADLIVCVGTRLTDMTTASRSLFQHPHVQFLALNVHAGDAHKLGAEPVVADAKLALDALRDLLGDYRPREPYRREIHEHNRRWQQELDDDLGPRTGETMTQGQLLRTLNQYVGADDAIVAAAGFLPGDILKLWDTSPGTFCHLEFGYSVMGGEIPGALGVRLARLHAGEVYALLGDGSYLMASSELATAVQEDVKITAIIIDNGGYQSIHALQRARSGISFGNEFRRRDDGGDLAGDFVAIDYVANARSLGCSVFAADSPSELIDALEAAKAEPRPCAIVATVERYRGLLSADTWWDLGISQASDRPETQRLASANAHEQMAQRRYP